jgi:hypothetical protein
MLQVAVRQLAVSAPARSVECNWAMTLLDSDADASVRRDIRGSFIALDRKRWRSAWLRFPLEV